MPLITILQTLPGHGNNNKTVQNSAVVLELISPTLQLILLPVYLILCGDYEM